MAEYQPLNEEVPAPSGVKRSNSEAVLSAFGGKGLTSAQAADQLAKWGRNEIPEEKEPLWRMFVMQFVGTMPAMIEIAMGLSALLGSWLDFWIIFALLMTNATLGFVEEVNAQASIAALKDGLVRKLPIKRDGQFNPMDIAELVPGDVRFALASNVPTHHHYPYTTQWHSQTRICLRPVHLCLPLATRHDYTSARSAALRSSSCVAATSSPQIASGSRAMNWRWTRRH